MDALKNLVTQLERDVKKYVEDSPLMQRIGLSLISVDRDLPLETFLENLTQNVNDLLKFLEDQINERNSQLEELQKNLANRDDLIAQLQITLENYQQSFLQKEFQTVDDKNIEKENEILGLSAIGQGENIEEKNNQNFLSGHEIDIDEQQIAVKIYVKEEEIQEDSTKMKNKQNSLQEAIQQSLSNIEKNVKEQYNYQIHSLTEQLQSGKKKYDHLLKENEDLKRNLSSFQSLQMNNFLNPSEINSMRQEIEFQKQQLDQLKEEIEDHEETEEKFQQQIGQLKKKNFEYEKQLEESVAGHQYQAVRDSFQNFFKISFDKKQICIYQQLIQKHQQINNKSSKQNELQKPEEYLKILLNLLGISDQIKKEFITLHQQANANSKKFKFF